MGKHSRGGPQDLARPDLGGFDSSARRAATPPRRRRALSEHTGGSEESGISPVTALLSLVSVLTLIVLLVIASGSTRVSQPQHLNGDALGPEYGEDLAAYAQRADETLARATEADAAGTGAHMWAMVTFAQPLDVSGTVAAVTDVLQLRVSGLIIGVNYVRDIPEPTTDSTLSDLVAAEVELVAAAAGVPLTDDQVKVGGLIVYGDVTALKQLRQRPEIAAVEALPADAVHGRFGIKPFVVEAAPAPESEPSVEDTQPDVGN